MDIEIKVWGHLPEQDYRMFERCSFSPLMVPEYDGEVICDHTNLLFTGLRDKNGVKIFKGDTVSLFEVPGFESYQEVVYHNGAFGYCVEPAGFLAFAENNHFNWIDGKSNHIEVINPELLESKDWP
jgi:hypothetical protein